MPKEDAVEDASIVKHISIFMEMLSKIAACQLYGSVVMLMEFPDFVHTPPCVFHAKLVLGCARILVVREPVRSTSSRSEA